jgi:hypothetical protein
MTGLLFGLVPALQIPLASVHNALKDSSRGMSGTKRHTPTQSVLVVSEIVFACLLLVGAGLLGRSFLNVLGVHFGFQPEHADAPRIDRSSDSLTPSQRDTFFTGVLDRARDLPGVSAAGLADVLPLVGDRSWEISAKGKSFERGQYPEGFIRYISDGYLQAVGISLVAGRDFLGRDMMPASEPVALVNETTELGIRMALGASAGELQTRVLLHALRLAGIGMVIGSLVAWFLSRALESLLFGIMSTDPATFFGTMLVRALAASLAGYLPALRISRIEPTAALRTD